jgi:hypothetical protein
MWLSHTNDLIRFRVTTVTQVHICHRESLDENIFFKKLLLLYFMVQSNGLKWEKIETI